MPNLMDNANFNVVNNTSGKLYNDYQFARQNPAQFEEHIKRTNPQAYQQALALRNMGNPQQIVMQMLQQRGLDPRFLQMLNL